MTYWRKNTEADEFIEIAMIALGNQNDKERLTDKVVYQSYNSPMQFLRYRKTVLGFGSLVKKWKNNLEKDIGEPNGHYARSSFDLTTDDGKVAWYNHYLIEKVNHYLNSNLRWQNGNSGKHQFNHAKDIYYYFKKEENYS
jgi:hypothetical protein